MKYPSAPVKYLAVLALLIGLVFVFGCDSVDERPEAVAFDAVVQVFVIGTGPSTWVLKVDGTNDSYYPVNLPKEFHEEGARVRVEGLDLKYDVLLHPALEITSIQRIND